jgi:predicted transcriptional regulator
MNPNELKIMKKIAEHELITKIELKKFLMTSGGTASDASIDSVTRNLIQKNLITTVNMVGSTCYIITKRGAQVLKEID